MALQTAHLRQKSQYKPWIPVVDCDVKLCQICNIQYLYPSKICSPKHQCFYPYKADITFIMNVRMRYWGFFMQSHI